MNTLVLVAVERQGAVVPICRSRRPEVVRVVAQAALADAQEAAAQELGGDEVLAALLRQEVERLKKALTVLGLAQGMGFNPGG